MKTMTLIGLISAGIIIGAVGNSYFSNKNTSSELSSATLDNNSLVTGKAKQNNSVIGNKKQNNKVHQRNPFDNILAPSATANEYEENLFKTDTSSTLDNPDSASYTDFQTSVIERPEKIIKLNAAENTFSVFGNVGALTWEPSSTTDYESIQIRLSGPSNTTITRDFYNGEVANITETLPDGYYNWQTVTTPTIDPYIKQQMAAVRESGDSVAEEELVQRFRKEGSLLTREQAKNQVQSGGFRVINGQLLDVEITE